MHGNEFRMGWLLCALLILSAMLAPRARAATGDCRAHAAAFRERLESVAESVVEGRKMNLTGVAGRIADRYATEHAAMHADSISDSTLDAMRRSASAGDSAGTARRAVELALASLDWCGGAPTVDEDLMRLDLAGMAAWLMADSRDIAWPAGVDDALARVAAGLEKKGRAPLAATLGKSVAAARAAALDRSGERKPATALLDLIDVVEKALR